MAETRLGGIRARETNLKKYGTQFYVNIGAMGGRKGTTGGFAANHELAVEAGRKGGTVSRRGVPEDKIIAAWLVYPSIKYVALRTGLRYNSAAARILRLRKAGKIT